MRVRKKKSARGKKKKVLPGIEPGFRDSESPVITVTLQDLMAGPEFCVTFSQVHHITKQKVRTPGGDRTRDPRLIRPVLYL